MKFCQALNGSLNIERDRVHYCYVVKQNMPSIPWNPDEALPIERIQIVRKALIKSLNEDLDQVVPEYERFGEHSCGSHPCKGCRMIVDINDNAEVPCPDQLSFYLHMQAFTYCNSKCIYCHLSRDAGRTPIHQGKDLDKAVYGAVNFLLDNNMVGPDCRVIFSSGEPSLSKLGMETLNRLVEMKQDILVNTNAIEFSPDLERALKAGTTHMQVSLDSGDRESYLAIKGVDKFDAVAENIDRYISAIAGASQFWLKYIVYSKTNSKDTLDKFIEFCSAHRIRNVVVNMNYNEGEAVSSNLYAKADGPAVDEIADIATIRAYGYLASKLELGGFNVVKECAHQTTHERQLAEREYHKAMQVQLFPGNQVIGEMPLNRVTILNLTPRGEAIENIASSAGSPLRDTDVAAIHLAAALKKQGIAVEILKSRENLKAHQCDIFIINGEWDILAEGILPGKLNYLWCQDDFNPSESGKLQEQSRAAAVYHTGSGVIFTSHYQQQRWLQGLSLPLEKVYLSSLGVALDKFNATPEALASRPPQAYYQTASRQGLVMLLKGWPMIKTAVPEARLHIYSSDEVYQTPEKEFFRPLYQLAMKLDGVSYHGPAGQDQLIKAAQECRVFASPIVSAKVSCIRELEAMAGGSVVVSMALGALPETAWRNPLVSLTDGWLNRWAAEVVRLLVDDQHYRRLARQNLITATFFDWDTIAFDLLERFRLDLAQAQDPAALRHPSSQTQAQFNPEANTGLCRQISQAIPAVA